VHLRFDQAVAAGNEVLAGDEVVEVAIAVEVEPTESPAAIAAGADGLILEVHPDPERALSDGYQSLNFPQFLDCLARCRVVAGALGKSL
jgi:3-deoxy-D-arabino-heptulosonate 7-phosphate (DAHP) synthase